MAIDRTLYGQGPSIAGRLEAASTQPYERTYAELGWRRPRPAVLVLKLLMKILREDTPEMPLADKAVAPQAHARRQSHVMLYQYPSTLCDAIPNNTAAATRCECRGRDTIGLNKLIGGRAGGPAEADAGRYPHETSNNANACSPDKHDTSVQINKAAPNRRVSPFLSASAHCKLYRPRNNSVLMQNTHESSQFHSLTYSSSWARASLTNTMEI